MANVYLKDTTLKSIGNAIREKTGETGLLLPSEMANAIANISGGGGGIDLPTPGKSKVAMYEGSSSSKYMYIDDNIAMYPDKIQQISFYTSGYGGFRGDYNTGFFYEKDVCRMWQDSDGLYNFSLVSVGTAIKSRYNYRGYSCDLASGYSYLYTESSDSDHLHAYCYLRLDPNNGEVCVWYRTGTPAPEGFNPTDSPLIASVLSYNGPFIVIYE